MLMMMMMSRTVGDDTRQHRAFCASDETTSQFSAATTLWDTRDIPSNSGEAGDQVYLVASNLYD